MFIRIPALLLLLWATAGQAQELVLRALDEDRGLPSNCVLTLHVDGAGYLWVATNKGLYRYDGFSFARIGAGTALDEVNVLAIKEVPELGLHALVGNGARLFLLEGDAVSEVAIPEPDGKGNDVGTLTGLAVDTAMRLIAGFEDRAGQVVVDLRTRKATYSRWPSRSVGHVAQVNGQITTWLCPPNNATVAADSIDVPAFRGRIPFRGTHLINSFKAGALSNERAWFTHQDQLHFMDRGRIITYPMPDRVLGVTEDATGRLWVRIWDHGVRCFDPSYTPMSLNAEALHRTHVTACVQDRQGGLWFSTIDRGLFHCASSEVMFFSARRTLKAPWASCLAGLPDGQVATATGNSRVLSLTADGGVQALMETTEQGNTHEVKALLFDGPAHLYPGRLDRSIDIHTGAVRVYPERDPRWIGVYDLMHLGGDRYLKAYIMGAEVIQLPATRRSATRPVSQERCYRILADQVPGSYLIATHKGIRRAVDDGIDLRLEPYSESTSRTYDLLWCGDTLWAATHQGLVAYRAGKTLPGLAQRTIGATQVRALALEGGRWLWAATLDGLYRVDTWRPGDLPERFGRGQGLPSDALYDVLVHHDRLWVISGPDVATFALQRQPAPASNVTLEVLSIHGNDTLDAGTRTTFPHAVDRVTIALRNLDYARSTRAPFRYRTSPAAAWARNEGPELQLLGLAPGRYDVEIQAIDANGRWSDSVHAQWTIAPPFWATIWFQVILVLLFTSMITVAIHQYTVRKQRMARLVADARNHHHKALLAQLEPHFVFNALNSIQSFVAANDPANSTRYLAKFAKLMRGLLNAAHNETVSLHEEMDLLQHYCALEALRQQPTFSYSVSAHPALDQADIRFPSFLVQPYVENAIRHGLRNLPHDRPGELLIRFEPHGPLAMRCTVQDNGIGRAAASRLSEKSAAWRSLGTLVNEERLPLLSRMIPGGNYTIDTTDLTAPDGNSAGTRVEIIMPITTVTGSMEGMEQTTQHNA